MTEPIDQKPADLSFDLTTRPWIPVQRLDGSQDELSLREVFAQAGDLLRVVGDLPTQDFALTRLLLAVAHDVFDGPADIEDWADLWADEQCYAPVPAYLDEHRDRFDLLHPQAPFFQVAGLRTGRDEVFSLNRIVADVPNGDPFFTARMPTVARLGFAEAARWVVHAHAYDTSGIKTGIDGDKRVKGGKVYPLGVGWAGTLGGVLVEGATLRETLLLNLVAADTTDLRFEPGDRPAWRHTPCGPGVTDDRRPTGVRDLYTWQTRRLRLYADADGVHGVVLGYGDPLVPRNMHTREPMTAWRRSPAQEKKHGEALSYLPREHDPSRSAWRGLEALLADRTEAAQGSDPARTLRPRVLEWIARLSTGGWLPRGFLIRTRVVGAVYGTQQSVIDEIVDDRLSMGVVLLHQQDREYATAAIDAVGDADRAVRALGDLATNLARATGADPEGPRATARDLGFGALDGPYRLWLHNLAEADNPLEQRGLWQKDVYRYLRQLGDQLLRQAGDAGWEGRVIAAKNGSLWLNSGLAEQWFRSSLNESLGSAFPAQEPDLPGGARMTTTIPALSAGERAGRLTGRLITPLQHGYLKDQSHAVGALARLRRGAGKDFARTPDLWGLTDTGSLHEIPEGGWPLRETELVRAEDAVHVALTLWALHQQSRGTGMHRTGTRTAPQALGTAVRRLMPPGDIDEPVRKRFVRAGNAPDLPALAQRLREIVVLLRGADIPLDYALLAQQLYQWQEPGGRDDVRRAWGRSFHAHRPPRPGKPGATPDAGASPAGHDDTTDLTDKDAS